MTTLKLLFCAALGAASLLAQGVPKKDQTLGYDDTPMLPGQKYRVHDSSRPHPPVVTPAAEPGAPPSDAIVLFDGKDLSQWESKVSNSKHGRNGAPEWKVEKGYLEVVPLTGDLVTKQSFGDIQLHGEWQEPEDVTGAGQSRGNSGFWFQSRYEVQVLDSFNAPTYADGQAGAVYGQWPPLVNPVKAPGKWQAYDIIFEAPRFEGEKLVKPAYVTVTLNGVVVQNHQAYLGATVHRKVAAYTPHPPMQPLMLQNHNSKVRFRNIWVRPLGSYE